MDKETNLFTGEKIVKEGLDRIADTERYNSVLQRKSLNLLTELEEFKSVSKELQEVNLVLSTKKQ